MKDTRIWINNFNVERAGYCLVAPMFDWGLLYGQKVMFEKFPFTEFFACMKGVDAMGGFFIEYELDAMIQRTMKQILTNPSKIEKIHKQTYRLNRLYYNLAKEIISLDLEVFSDRKLGELFKKLMELQARSHMHAITTTWYVDSVGETFSKYLIDKVKKLVKKSGKDIDPANAFSVLTTKAENSLTMQEEIESLRIVDKIQANEQAGEIFKNLENFEEIPNVDHYIKSDIHEHYHHWRWMPFNYMGPAYGIDYYLQVWSGLVKENINAKDKITEHLDRPSKVRKEKNRIANQLTLCKKDQRILDLAADIVSLKGYRKECIFIGSYSLSKIFKEMAKRKFLALNQMYVLTHNEVKDIFINGAELDLAEINRRQKFSIMYNNRGKFEIISGDKALKWFESKNVKEEELDLDTDELHGTTACSGKAEGEVVIINRMEDVPKMKVGGVMVSHSTFPSYLPAMKKASAILTEDGGITCHAAIVSRELNTPCITGIRSATKVLNDGDVVDVDASEGIVKIKSRIESRIESK